MMITVDMIKAIKVTFLKPFFEDDFVERGMQAWLTKVEWCNRKELYELYFDFSDFEEENAKYFTCTYYPNSHTVDLQRDTDRTLFTAIEAGMYHPKQCFYWSTKDGMRDDMEFAAKVTEYIIEE